MNRAGFEGIEKASTEDLMKIVKAYKEALKSGKKFEKMEEVEVDGKTDEEIGEQIKGGCRRIAVSGVSSVNKDTGRRFCVVPVTVEETLKKQGIRFLDVDGNGDDTHWGEKVELLFGSGKANESMKKENDSSKKVDMIKASCRDLKTAPTTSGGFNSFLTVATTYCSIKGK
ncbi:hypothetical protein A6V39_03270 [Candidatus Mycoplasma haematobovis]|uniref:Uncharacterized protein n=1 Tax=Candidatus Mycoplasma haematobovis TaxID=432608 RepID=A0A1A9QD71_9MOLU|nr:hypothetical protein [Candidatus Mycoplasma haematobovis]OAL09905.1 hypothetical protein A6V39_03270 [Candidatus Mycoplasma haematobovis]